MRTSRTDCHFCFPLQSCGRSRTFWPYDFFFSSGSCTRVCVSLIHSVVQILRFAFSVAVPLCSCAQMLLSSGSCSLRVDYGSDPRGSAYRLPPARLLTSHATRAAGTRPSSACVEPLGRPLAVTAGWADTSASESACLHRGGHPTERVRSVVWGCTPDPVDLSSPRWSPPLPRSTASALPEGSHMPRAEEKSH